MTTLPAASDFTGSTITEAQFKTAIANLISYLTGLLATDGTPAAALAALGALAGQTVSKTGAYTVVATDRGKVFLCSGTFTLSLSAAATLAAGFSFAVINIGSGTITIDPNSTETIDGDPTKAVAAGAGFICVCNGTGWYTLGYSLPTATASVLGGVKIGDRISIAGGVISADLQLQQHAAGSYSMLQVMKTHTLTTTTTEYREYKIARAGTIRVRLGVKSDGNLGGSYVYAYVYKNDTLIGTLSKTYAECYGVWVYENFDITVDSSDTIQIKARGTAVDAGYAAWATAFIMTNYPADLGVLYSYIDA